MTQKEQPQTREGGEQQKDYLADLRHDLQDEKYALEYLSACALDGGEALRVGIHDLFAALRAARQQERGPCECPFPPEPHPRSVHLVGTRKPTEEEKAYGLSLEPLAQEVLRAGQQEQPREAYDVESKLDAHGNRAWDVACSIIRNDVWKDHLGNALPYEVLIQANALQKIQEALAERDVRAALAAAPPPSEGEK